MSFPGRGPVEARPGNVLNDHPTFGGARLLPTKLQPLGSLLKTPKTPPPDNFLSLPKAPLRSF